MKIALICSPLIECPPPNYGGIERIVFWLSRKLIEMGHEVTLFGKVGSSLPYGHTICYSNGEDQGYADLIHDQDLKVNFDIIHDVTHDKILSNTYPELNFKILNTLQGLARRGPNTTCISVAQKVKLEYDEYVPVVYQGIPIAEYPYYSDPSGDYFLYMGSINDYKGVDIAADLCNKTNQKLIIAGVCWDPPYFERLVEPLLSDNVSFVGEVGGQAKLDLLGNAKALIHPVRWVEPGAIIVGEALSCGVPVIGSNNGVLPELINPACGIICEVQEFDQYSKFSGGSYNVDQWIEALNSIDSINREDCHEYAQTFLTDSIMTIKYLNCYERLLRDGGWA